MIQREGRREVVERCRSAASEGAAQRAVPVHRTASFQVLLADAVCPACCRCCCCYPAPSAFSDSQASIHSLQGRGGRGHAGMQA